MGPLAVAVFVPLRAARCSARGVSWRHSGAPGSIPKRVSEVRILPGAQASARLARAIHGRIFIPPLEIRTPTFPLFEDRQRLRGSGARSPRSPHWVSHLHI